MPTQLSTPNTQLLHQHFATLAETPDAIPKFRKAIFSLAVQGRLVPQLASDGSGADLLAKIARAKHEFETNGGSRRAKHYEQIKTDRTAWGTLPQAWRSSTVGDVALSVSNGCSEPQSKIPSKFRVTRIETISDGTVNLNKIGFIDDLSDEAVAKYRLYKGDILLSHINSTEHLGKTAVFEDDTLLLHGTNLLLLRLPQDFVVPRFFHLVMRALRDFGYFSSIAQHAIHQASINQTKLRSCPFPLPPLAEQRRIVAKVEELLALCDELEARQTVAREHRTGLVYSALDHLTTQDDSDFKKHSAFCLQHSELLFDSVPALRQAILSLAVEGRLLRQQMTDRSADEDLNLIRVKKKQLGLRKVTALPPITAGEHLFPLPHGWAWARWADISDWITYGFTRPMPHVEKGIPIATAKHVLDGWIDLGDCHKTDEESFTALSEKDRPVAGDVLLTKDGSIGRAAVVPPDLKFCINQSVAVIWLRSCHLSREFLLLTIRSQWMQRPMWAKAEGMAIKHISVVDFGRMLVPIPPLAEQQRIVAKVDELMRWCDALEARLTDARTAATHLLDATLHQILTDNGATACKAGPLELAPA